MKLFDEFVMKLGDAVVLGPIMEQKENHLLLSFKFVAKEKIEAVPEIYGVNYERADDGAIQPQERDEMDKMLLKKLDKVTLNEKDELVVNFDLHINIF